MPKIKKKLFIMHPIYWLTGASLGILWLMTRSPYHWQIKFGKFIGKLLYYFSSKLTYIAEKNIQHCFPQLTPQQQKELLKKNFISVGIGLIETAMAWWLPDKKLNFPYQLQGLEHFEKALAHGKGIILLGPHFTSLEMVGRLLGMKYSVAVMYRPHKKPLLKYIQEHFRQSHYARTIPRHRIRQLLKTLHQNVAVWYAYDIDAGEKRSVFAPFFGIPTASLTAVSRIVRLSSAVVIPISFYRNYNELGYEIILSPPLENFPTQDLVADATRLNAILEQAIRYKPEQYIWQYKRFKTRPIGEKRFY